MATRKTKATIPATPFVETITPEAPEQKSYDFAAHMHKILDDALKFEMPSWKRLVMAWLASAVTAFGVGYLVGHVMVYCLIGAAVLTTSTFVAWLIVIIGFLIAMYLGAKASAYTYTKIVDKSVDRAYDSAKNWVTSFFASTPKGATA